MENDKLRGVFNLTSPNPVTMKEFYKKLGKALKKPSWLPVPAFVIRKIFGEMADEMILSGQRVIPEKLLDAGFEFKYDNVENALDAM